MVYGKAGRKWPPRYRCDTCLAHVGTHSDTDPPEPLGTLANPEVRELRRQCHDAFDVHWLNPHRGRINRRKRAYAQLARFLGIPEDECHIGSWQDLECRRFLEQAMEFAKYMRGG